MDRRFVCQACGTKWFIPSERDVDDLTRCEACGGDLGRLDDQGLPSWRHGAGSPAGDPDADRMA